MEHSEWASPAIGIVKPNDDLRIVGNYSVTINKVAVMEQYPALYQLWKSCWVSCNEESNILRFTFHKLTTYWSLSQQVQSTSPSTLIKVCQYKCLTYGVCSAVSIFQCTIENVSKDLPRYCVHIDNVLISGETDNIHLEFQLMLESAYLELWSWDFTI